MKTVVTESHEHRHGTNKNRRTCGVGYKFDVDTHAVSSMRISSTLRQNLRLILMIAAGDE